MTQEDVAKAIQDLALRGPSSDRREDLIKAAVNLGLELAASSLAGPGGNNDYFYTGSPETGYMRQVALSKQIRNLKL